MTIAITLPRWLVVLMVVIAVYYGLRALTQSEGSTGTLETS